MRTHRVASSLSSLLLMLLAVPAHSAVLRPIKVNYGGEYDAVHKIELLIQRGVAKSLPAMDENVVIEPIIKEIRFTGGGMRFLIGPFGKSSLVRMTVRATRGSDVWEQEFYEHANAFTGTVTIGITDNNMLERIAESAVAYIKNEAWRTEPPTSVLPPAGVRESAADNVSQAPPPDELYQKLLHLDDLRKRGIITDAEFDEQKKRLLNDS